MAGGPKPRHKVRAAQPVGAGCGQVEVINILPRLVAHPAANVDRDGVTPGPVAPGQQQAGALEQIGQGPRIDIVDLHTLELDLQVGEQRVSNGTVEIGEARFQILAGLDVGHRAAGVGRQAVEEVGIDVIAHTKDVQPGLDPAVGLGNPPGDGPLVGDARRGQAVG